MHHRVVQHRIFTEATVVNNHPVLQESSYNCQIT